MTELEPSRTLILNSHNAYQCLQSRMTSDVEELWVMALDAGQGLRAVECIFRGTVDACMAHPRDIFRFGCKTNASKLIIAHNHPSGDLVPSDQDLRFTKRLIQLGVMMQIPIVDHMILTTDRYISLADWGFFSTRRKRSLRA